MPSTSQCNRCGLAVCAGWFHYHEITAEGFGSATLAYCGACGTCHRIEHYTTERQRRSPRPRSRGAGDVQRALLGLGAGLVITAVLLPIGLWSRRAHGAGRDGDLYQSLAIMTVVTMVLGFVLIETPDILAPHSLRAFAKAAERRRRGLLLAGAAAGLAAMVCALAAAAIMWGAGVGFDSTASIAIPMIAGLVTSIGAVHLGSRLRALPRVPSLWKQATRGLRRLKRRRRASKVVAPPPSRPDRVWRQDGPVELAPGDDLLGDPEFGPWIAVDPGCDVRPVRTGRGKGTLEAIEDTLDLSPINCGRCGARGSLVTNPTERPACPRCKDGVLETRSVWMT